MAAAAAWPRPALAQVTDAGRAAMAGAATAFLGALPDDARRRALIAFADKERFNWHYVPRGREGLPFKAMPAPARSAAHELMKASLSAVGYAKAVNVIRLETVLRQLETFGGLLRDAENYSVTVFGAPDSTAVPWGWRLEGHHLSLNFTLVPGKPVAVTPAFFGANPAEVRSGPLKGLRTLAREQDLGRGAGPEHGRGPAPAHDHLGPVARRHRLGARALRRASRPRWDCPRSIWRRPSGSSWCSSSRSTRATCAPTWPMSISAGSGRRASSAFTSRGPGRSIQGMPTTTASTGRPC